MEINNKELTEMVNVLAKQIVNVAKISFTEYNRTFVSVIKAIGSKNTYTILDEYNIERVVPMGVPYISLSIGQRVYVTVPNGDINKMYISGIYMQTNRGQVNMGTSTISPNSIGAYTSAQVDNLLSDKAQKYHASSSTDFGLGTGSLYGHVKIINGLTQNSHVDGTALSAYQGKVLKGLIDDEITDRGAAINDLNATDPSASGSSISFIDSVSQTKGKISATKKSVRIASSSQTGVVKPDDETITVDSNGTMSVKSVADRTTRSTLDIIDNTDIITSENASSGFDSSNNIFRRKALYIWNYIKSKISLMCGKIIIATDESYNATSVNPIVSATYKNEDGSITLNANGIISIVGTDSAVNTKPSVSIGAKGSTFIHGGDCGTTFPEEANIYDDNNLYLLSDDSICLYPNCSSDSSTISSPITFYENSIGGANCNYYGTCDTQDSEPDKEVIVTDSNFQLVVGAIVGIKFDETNLANNITLNVNDTGAISIYSSGAVVTTGDGGCIANYVSFYMYNGTYWCKMF